MIIFLLGVLIIPCVHGDVHGGRLSGLVESATATNFGYEVAILSRSSYICGGSIISLRYVISAAHCTDGHPPSSFSARTCTSSTAINVVRIHQHPNYNPSTMDFDLSILHLEYHINGIPILLPADNHPIPIGMQGIVSVCHLEPVPQQIVGSSQCIVVGGYKFCAQNVEGHGGLCSGASGAPLVIDRKLLGVFSLNYGCVQNLPNVYTNVASLRGFIRQITGI